MGPSNHESDRSGDGVGEAANEENAGSILSSDRRGVLGALAGTAGLLSLSGIASAQDGSGSGTGTLAQGDNLQFGVRTFGNASNGLDAINIRKDGSFTTGARAVQQSSSGAGVFGAASSSTGNTFGVFGRSNSSSGAGVTGRAVASSGNTVGMLGIADSPQGTGLSGQARADTGTAVGLRGISESNEGFGVIGNVVNGSGTVTGVLGQTQSNAGIGVRGESGQSGDVATDLARPAGVRGNTGSDGDVANDAAPVGVHGNATGSGVTGGVFGEADSKSGLGVIGSAADGDVTNLLTLASGTSGFTAGVVGFTDRNAEDPDVTNAFGVIGVAGATSGEANGVYGRTFSASGYGVYSDDRVFARSESSSTDYVARFEADNSNIGSVLDLQTTGTDPGTGKNFITFLDGTGSAVGAIEGNGTGGVQMTSGGADVAEFFPKADTDETFEAGTVVGLDGGEVSRDTDGANSASVVSETAMLTGNVPGTADEDDHTQIALLGQVPTKVGTTVDAGDTLVDGGDGTAVSEDRSDRDRPLVVGVALEDGEPGEKVTTLVGNQPAPSTPENESVGDEAELKELRETVERQAETIDRLEARLDALERDADADTDAEGSPATPADD